MEKRFINYISKLEAYKTAIKNLHWSSRNMSEHKLLDDISDTVASNQDEISEISQGIFENIKINQLRPKRYNIKSTQDMLKDLLKDTKNFYSTIKGRQFIGLRSVVEAFIGDINKYQYLVRFVMKEAMIKRLKNHLNETRKNDNALRLLIREAIYDSFYDSSEGVNVRRYKFTIPLSEFDLDGCLEQYGLDGSLPFSCDIEFSKVDGKPTYNAWWDCDDDEETFEDYYDALYEFSESEDFKSVVRDRAMADDEEWDNYEEDEPPTMSPGSFTSNPPNRYGPIQ